MTWSQGHVNAMRVSLARMNKFGVPRKVNQIGLKPLFTKKESESPICK